MGRSEQHHSWQHANTTEASINWPLFSHFDLGVAYQHTELKPPWRELATVYASTGLYGGNTPPPSAPFSTGNGGQPVLDPTSTPLAVPHGGPTVRLPSGQRSGFRVQRLAFSRSFTVSRSPPRVLAFSPSPTSAARPR
jgi:hypothetical protein